DRDQDREGIRASLAQVDDLLDDQIERGIPAANLVLAGFSQGGAIALRCGLARGRALAGIMVLSAYLLEADRLSEWSADDSARVPIFMGHGSQDPVVPAGLGQASAERLRAAGHVVEWQTWPMPHSVCPEEIAAIDEWLERCWG
ncbi:MAG: alpha/beta hydrolase, partial [Wenzhouxiangella sp.]